MITKSLWETSPPFTAPARDARRSRFFGLRLEPDCFDLRFSLLLFLVRLRPLRLSALNPGCPEDSFAGSAPDLLTRRQVSQQDHIAAAALSFLHVPSL